MLEKKFYSQILNSFSEGFVVYDKDGKIIYFNKMATTILGLTEDQLLGKSANDPIWKIIREDGSDYPGDERPAMRTIRSGEAYHDVIMGIQFSNQDTRWLKVNTCPIYEVYEGVEARVLVTFADITTQYLNERMLSGLIHNSPGMIYNFKITKNGEMSFPFISPKGYEIYEVSKEDVEKNPNIFLDMVHEEDKQSQVEESIKASQSLKDFEWVGRIRVKNEKIKWIRVKGQPHLDHDGSILYDGIVMDITNEILLQEELDLERVRSAQTSKLASLGELSAGVAHEINNPLMIISSNIQTIDKYLNDPVKLKNKFMKIEKSVERITKIVNGLKRFSRMEPVTEKVNVNFSRVLDDAMTFIKMKSAQSEAVLNVECYSSAKIFCNPIEIEQVLINLVNNALDAIKDQEVKWVHIIVQDKNESVLIKVIDSGHGLPETILNKIFDPFFTTKNVGEGTGLGLSISRSIIQDHGGDLSYHLENQHTCFQINIPTK